MAGIVSIISAYNVNTKKISDKLIFEVGQIFPAKIIKSNDSNKEVILQLANGWQIPAKFEKPLNFIPEGLMKFQVENFKDGKLQVKITDNKKKENIKENYIKEFIFDDKENINKEDYEILNKMIKHNMPITNENISKIKSIIDFKNKIENDNKKEELFIEKYIKSKNIDLSSENGKYIKKIIKGFLKEFKNLNTDDIFTMIENNIDLNEDNIKSFLKLSKEDNTIYKELKNLNLKYEESYIYNKNDFLNNKLKNLSEIKYKELDFLVKEQIKNKTEEMKNAIQNIIKDIESYNNDKFNKISDIVKEYINDFKVFNSISSQYYYLNVPINLNKYEYNCKLLIKDDRKSGKKIDSQNVNIAVSVKTSYIGIVDAYIKVRENNMHIDIKCGEKWIHILDSRKDKLLENLSNISYNVSLNFDKRNTEVNISNFSDIFNDNYLEGINIIV